MWSPRHSTPNKEEEVDKVATRDNTRGIVKVCPISVLLRVFTSREGERKDRDRTR